MSPSKNCEQIKIFLVRAESLNSLNFSLGCLAQLYHRNNTGVLVPSRLFSLNTVYISIYAEYK
jgi:hypothetical protein